MSGLGAPIAVRPEAPGDEEGICDLIQAAFKGVKHSSGIEPYIVDRLRKDGDLTLSLVALDRRRIVGHIATSPITISDGTDHWHGLGPVSVLPQWQGKGIGSALIRQAITDMKERSAKGIALLSSAHYYARFGFRHNAQLTVPGPYASCVQCLRLDGAWPSGDIQSTALA